MKYIQRTSRDIKENFTLELLRDRGIIQAGFSDSEEREKQYLNPTEKNLLNPLWLDNVEKGFALLKKHLENGSKIYLIVD